MRRSAASEYAFLAAVVLIAAAVALFWALRVPFYQEPDEIAHGDYVFALYDAGAPFAVRDPAPGHEIAPQTQYLMRAAGYRAMRYSIDARAPAGYGSHAYFAAVDAQAPSPSGRIPAAGARVPYMMLTYPFTYYAVAFAALGTAIGATHSISDGFFAMRAVGLAALCATLIFGYAALRRYGSSARVAALTALAAGIFPLTVSISASVQPDTLVTTFFTLAVLGGGLARDPRTRPAAYAILCIALCGLAMTKQHYALAAWAVTLPLALAVARTKRDALCVAAIALLPAGAFVFAYGAFGPVHGVESFVHFAQRTQAGGAPNAARPPATEVLAGALRSAVDGNIADTFWARFGFRGGRIFGGPVAKTVFAFADVAFAVIFLLAQYAVLRRVWAVARKRSGVGALRLIARGYPANLFMAVTAVLFAATVASRGALELQGRYWLPVIFVLAILTVRTIPRAIAPQRRRLLGLGAASGLAAYAAWASATAAFAMNAYFYGPPVRSAFVPAAEIATQGPIALSRPQATRVDGAAIDMTTGLPAKNVYLTVDGAHALIAKTGLPSPGLAIVFNDALVGSSGYRAVVPAALLPPGTHTIAAYVGRPGAGTAIRGTLEIRVGRGG